MDQLIVQSVFPFHPHAHTQRANEYVAFLVTKLNQTFRDWLMEDDCYQSVNGTNAIQCNKE